MPIQGEVVDAPFRANRRLMFVMRRFLYIALSIQMLLYCIIRFAVRYTFPYWASWMIWFGFGGQTIALIFLLAILPEIRVYAPRNSSVSGRILIVRATTGTSRRIQTLG